MKLPNANAALFCLVSLALATPVLSAPKHGSKRYGQPVTRYDQKQSGDFNIQVHLKDFHIIAVLGDDTWGGYGDYDYNYDYSDLTVKPALTATTASPESSNSSDPQKPDAGLEKPGEQPSSTEPSSTLKSSASTTPAAPDATTELAQNQPESSKRPENATAAPNGETPKAAEDNGESPITNVSVMPLENVGIVESEHLLPLGEVMHYRKCSEGFVKDKLGRCRRIVKTPPLQLGLARLASNLATKFRQATSEESSP